MKKTLALLGVGALGIAAGGAGALPANAEATEPCADFTEHVFTADVPPGNFYLECIPQYGLGKAEFTIVPDADNPTTEFPEGWTDLFDEAVSESSSSDVAALVEYYQEEASAPIMPLGSADPDTSTEQGYLAAIVAPVTGVGAATEEMIPEGVAELCNFEETTYENAWFATFAPVDTTFSRTFGEDTWSWTVTGTPGTTFYLGTITADGVDTEEPWCISDGVGVLNAEVDGPGADDFYRFVYHGLPDLDTEQLTTADFGTFEAVVTRPAPAPAPVLAATGMNDPLAPMIAGGFLALLGTALIGVTGLLRRRKQA